MLELIVAKVVITLLVAGLVCLLVGTLVGPVVVGSNEVAVIEKKFSGKSLENGQFIAMNGEAGYQSDVLRAGLHFRNRIIYKIHKCPLITIKQGQIGYVFARSGEALNIDQALGREVECNNFQDTKEFLNNHGQKGPQRMILREGTYAFNLAQFIIITEDTTYFLPIGNKAESQAITEMREEIDNRNGFTPVVINTNDDKIGVVVTFEGKSLRPEDIIAPIVGSEDENSDCYHNGFQNIEAFLRAGGYKGRQHQVLTEGTYFLNRLFATVDFKPKTVIDVSFVGVVNSYIGNKGTDLSGSEYTHGELVEEGCKGIWATPLSPGKYALNPYAQEVILVPTDNFSLKWVKGEVGQYKYDEKLRELSVITKDGFQPLLPLSVVVHINYLKAPLMIQRFGSVQKLVEQTLDTIISAHFKQVAETKTFLEIVQNKAGIAKEVMERMSEEFKRFNLELEDVLIDTPRSNGDTRIDALIEQLATRQLSKEQVLTYQAQMEAFAKEREVKELEAKAEQQSALTQSKISIEIKDNQAEAERKVAERNASKLQIETDANAYRIRKQAEIEAEKTKLIAGAEAEKTKLTASAEAERTRLIASAEATKITQLADAQAHKELTVGEAIAEASKKQVDAYGGAELLVQKEVSLAIANAIKEGKIAIVPQNYIAGGDNSNDGFNALGNLLKIASMEKLGVQFTSKEETKEASKTLGTESKIERIGNEAPLSKNAGDIGETSTVIGNESVGSNKGITKKNTSNQ